MNRRLHRDPTEEIAPRVAAHGFDTFVAQAKYASGLGFRRDLQCYIAIESRHLDRPAECRGREADRHLAAQVLAVTLEDGVLAHVNLDIQITWRSAVAPRLALATESDAIAGVDAGRDFHRQLAAAAYTALSEAGIAGILDDRARAAAPGAGLLQLEKALRNADLPGPAAGIASRRRAALGR